MHIPILVVRASVLPTTAEKRTHLLRAIKLAIPDAANRLGCVGVFCEYDARWTELHDFLAIWDVAQFETPPSLPNIPAIEVFYARFKPGLPQFTAQTAGV
jgi:hypothetical protein